MEFESASSLPDCGTVDCLIIGAGLTGLSAAFAAHNTLSIGLGGGADDEKSKGEENIVSDTLKDSSWRILVVDADDRVGGLVGTKLLSRDGAEVAAPELHLSNQSQQQQCINCPAATHDYLVELGPNSFQPTPRLLGLICALGLRGQIAAADPLAPRFLLHQDRLLSLPMSLKAFFFGFSPISFRSKIRAIAGFCGWRPNPSHTHAATQTAGGEGAAGGGRGGLSLSLHEDEESVGAFFDRLTGDPMFRHCLLQPFMSGVYTGDAMRLSGDVALGGLAAEDRAEGSVLLSLMRGKKALEGPLMVSNNDGANTHNSAPAGETAELGDKAKKQPLQYTRVQLESPAVKAAIGRFCPDVTPAEAGLRRGALCSFRNGMAVLPRALALWLRESSSRDGNDEREKGAVVRTDISLSTTVEAIRWNGAEGLWDVTLQRRQKCNDNSMSEGEIIKARTVYSTIPAYAAARLFGPNSPAMGAALVAIEYPSIAAVAIAVPASCLNREAPPCVAAAAAKREAAIAESLRNALAGLEDNYKVKKKVEQSDGDVKKDEEKEVEAKEDRLLASLSGLRGFGQLMTDFNCSIGRVPTRTDLPRKDDEATTTAGGSPSTTQTDRPNKVIGVIYASSLFPINRTPSGNEAAVRRRVEGETEVEEEAEDVLLCFVGGARHSPVTGMSEADLFNEVLLFLRHGGSVVRPEALAAAATAAVGDSDSSSRPMRVHCGGDSVRLLATKVWSQSIPQPTIGHQRRVAAAVAAASTELFSAEESAKNATAEGRTESIVAGGSWRDGVAVGDCVHAGIRRGTGLAQWLLKQQ